MFCYQCEETIPGGCKKIGVCGKNEEIAGLQDLVIFGLKGIAAYGYHAKELGFHDGQVDAFLHKALFHTLTNSNFNKAEHIALALETGAMAIRMMDTLDKAHTEILGVPAPVKVSQNAVEGKSILVTGHDLFALRKLLEQTQDKGILIYTHSEMLPAHGYPKLREFSHLKGNFGGAWHDQKKVFEQFPGAILATTNCVMPITSGTYKERMFSYGIAGLEGVQKIHNDDFSPLIQKSLSLPDAHIESSLTLTTGFHHRPLLENPEKIVQAVKDGKIKRFFVIAGCDGPEQSREYFRKLASSLPQDCIILTTSCGKFRFNDLDFGDIDGIPRLIDLGQCNNSISCIHIAQALADAFHCSVNDLPLTIVLMWFEQKAVAILLALLSLGVKNMFIGPKMPEFITPGILDLLQKEFNLRLITTVDEDLKRMM